MAMDGHTYEEAGILDWFTRSLTSPNTGLPLESRRLLPNYYARKDIAEYLEQRRAQRAAEAKGGPGEAKGEEKGAPYDATGEAEGEEEEAEREATAGVEAEGEGPTPVPQGPELKDGQGEEPGEGAKSAGGERRARRRGKNKTKQGESRGARGGEVDTVIPVTPARGLRGLFSRGFFLMRGKVLVGLIATAALAIVLRWVGGGGDPCGDAILASRAAVTVQEQAFALITLEGLADQSACADVLPALGLEASAVMRRWSGEAVMNGAACSLIVLLAEQDTSLAVSPARPRRGL
jgi:hypothetical protein